MINQTQEITGTQNLTQFNLTLEDNSTYKWNCLAYDNAVNSDWGEDNWTLIVSTPRPIGFYQYPTVSFYNETTEIILFEANRVVTVNETNEANITFRKHQESLILEHIRFAKASKS